MISLRTRIDCAHEGLHFLNGARILWVHAVTPRRQTSSISDGDEVRFIVSNGAGDVIQCGGPMRGKHVVDKLSRGLAEAEGKCTGTRKFTGN